jgi:LuxR family maltose regulon positive regulatory protein
LDDFHHVTSPEIHEDVAFALEHWPENARMVLSTRVDPPLPVARLRAAGRLLELRASDLRFSPEESARFVETSLTCSLEPEQIRLIGERAEGWIAGLKMTVLALQRPEDARSVIRSLSASPRVILDYLAQEVLERQELPMQDFLMRTAILERFCGPLCDAVTGRGDGQITLEEVGRRNLFLIQLDEANRWFRYHTLFADLLRARLQRAHPEILASLHDRASRWFEAEGLADEAFQHARAAGDTQRAVELLLAYSRKLTFSGWAATVERWLAATPEQTIREDLRLLVTRCWTRCFLNRWRGIADDLNRVEALLEAMPPADPAPDGDRDRLLRANARITLAILRSYLAYRGRDFPAALRLARRAVKAASGAPPVLQGAALTIHGYALMEAGDAGQAQDAFERAGPLLLAEHNLTAWAISILKVVDLQIARGLLKEADKTCQEALRLLRERHEITLPAASYALAAAAEAAWGRDDLPRAEALWLEATDAAGLTGDPDVVQRCTLGHCRLLAARGQGLEALELLATPDQTDVDHLSTPVSAAIEAQRSALWAALGRWEELRIWVGSFDGPTGEGLSAELQGIARVRALVALGSLDAAEGLCIQQLDQARATGRLGRAATLTVLQALIEWRRGEQETSLATLRQALEFCASEGSLRTLLDEGHALRDPLTELAIRLSNTSASAGSRAAAVLSMLHALLEAMPSPAGSVSPGSPFAAGEADGRPETLSSREQEVLGLLAAGHSNQQIADRLFISLATAKKHVSTLLEKLHAANRTRAVAVARRHGLL